jgi:pilus assembly protein Flp/PilA
VRLKNFFARFINDQAGATVIEYGLIAALISVVCIAGMTFVGAGLQGVYNAVSAAITPAL